MDEHMENLKKTFRNGLDDHVSFYVYKVRIGLGRTDIFRSNRLVTGFLNFEESVEEHEPGFEMSLFDPETGETWNVNANDLCVPKMNEDGNELTMVVPKTVLEEDGGELAVHREFISFLSDLYVRVCMKKVFGDCSDDFLDRVKFFYVNENPYGKTKEKPHKYSWHIEPSDWTSLGTIKDVKVSGETLVTDTSEKQGR